jgi:leucine dehydrogenase
MDTLALMSDMGHENVFYCNDAKTGLKAIIGIHDTTLGPALGGCRMLPYESEREALIDALRLSRGMTYKSAIAGINLGGGKSVIIADPVKQKTPELLKRFGEFLNRLGGKYITAEDMGTTVQDMDQIAEVSDFVTGKSKAKGGSGNPSPLTALGTYWGMKAAAKHAFETDSLKGKKIAIQGIGNVGYKLAKMLYDEGAELLVCDTNHEALAKAEEEFGATIVDLDEVYSLPMDIFAPCARGAIINDDSLKNFKAKVIAGAANNVLLDPDKHGQIVKKKGIIYAPDYVINAGGVINVYYELTGYDEEASHERCKNIYNTIDEILTLSASKNIPANVASQKVAELRIQQAKAQAQLKTK